MESTEPIAIELNDFRTKVPPLAETSCNRLVGVLPNTDENEADSEVDRDIEAPSDKESIAITSPVAKKFSDSIVLGISTNIRSG